MINRIEGIPTQPPHANSDDREAIARVEARQYSDEKLNQVDEHIRQEEQIRERYGEAMAEHTRITEKIEKVIKDITEYREKVRVVWDEYMESEDGRERLKLGVSNLETFLKLHSTLVEHKKIIDEKLDDIKDEFDRENQRLELLFIELKGGIASKN